MVYKMTLDIKYSNIFAELEQVVLSLNCLKFRFPVTNATFPLLSSKFKKNLRINTLFDIFALGKKIIFQNIHFQA